MPKPAALAVGVLLLVLAAACGGSDESTPTPPAFYQLSPDSLGSDMLAQLPSDEQSCIRDSLSSEEFDLFLSAPLDTEPDLAGDAFSVESGSVMLGCLSNDSIVRLFIGGIAMEAGSLSTATVTCMTNTLADIDFQALFADEVGLSSGFDSMVGGMLGMLLCLSDEEAERISVGSFFGSDEEGPTLADIRCITGFVDLDQLGQAFTTIAGAEALTSEMLTALTECGIDLFEGFDLSEGLPDGGDLSDLLEGFTSGGLPDLSDIEGLLGLLTPEQVQCIEDALGDITIDDYLSGRAVLGFEQVLALASCGLTDLP